MKYDEKTVSETQQKMAKKYIDSVRNGYPLEAPNFLVQGLNSNEEIAKLEFQKLEKNEKEIKKIDKKIKSIKRYCNNYVKVIFNFDNKIKKLIGMSDIMPTSRLFVPRYIWAGVLDYRVTSPFLFGRVSKIKRHGGGDYYFAPLNNQISDIISTIEKELPEFFPYDIIEVNIFIETLGNFKFVREVHNMLGTMASKIKLGEETTALVDALNQQKELIKEMKKIPHFGTTEYLTSRFVSQSDVSTLFIPYKEVTYFHIDQFVYPPKKHFSSIYSLLSFLETQH